MNYDDWPDNTMDKHRAAVRKTIRRTTQEELKNLALERFPVVTDPWCEKFNDFLKQHGDAAFYRAETHEGAEIVYCRESGQGVWFLPGSGMGIIQPKGLQLLAEIVDAL